MLATADIQLNQVAIGKIRIDSTQIRGEGGWLDPRLIMNAEIEMYPRAENQHFVLTEASCALKLENNPGTANQIGFAIHLGLKGSPAGSRLWP